MAEVIAFEDLKKLAKRSSVLDLFDDKPTRSVPTNTPAYPTARQGISGNLGDLFEQANAVAMRYYDGDSRVSSQVAAKCIELIKALSDHGRPE